jgi:hypothetical protein
MQEVDSLDYDEVQRARSRSSSSNEKSDRVGSARRHKKRTRASDSSSHERMTRSSKKALVPLSQSSSLSLGLSSLNMGNSFDELSEQMRDVLSFQEHAVDALGDPGFAQSREAMQVRRGLQAQNDEMHLDPHTFNSVILGQKDMQKLERYYGTVTEEEEETCFGCSRGLLWSNLSETELMNLERLIHEHMGCTNYYAIIKNIYDFYEKLREKYNRGVDDDAIKLPEWNKRTIFRHIFYHTLQVTASQNMLQSFFKKHFEIIARRAYHVPLKRVQRGNVTEADYRPIPKTHEMLLNTAKMVMALNSKIVSGKKPVYTPFSAASDQALVPKSGDHKKWLKPGMGSAF